MKMIQVGTNMNGDPVYNVTNEDGSLVKTTIFTQDEAQAFIDGPQIDTAMETVVTVSATEEISTENQYQDLSKKELEKLMREHGIELDRRKSKLDLLNQVSNFFKKEK